MNLNDQNITMTEAFKKLEPKMVLVFYKAENTVYVETTELNEGKPLGFRPITIEDIKKILGNIEAAEKGLIECKGLMPSNILFIDIVNGDFKIIWHRPASIKHLQFTSDLKCPNGRAKVPAMIYVATKTRLAVYALKDNKKPKLKTKLFVAPYLNVYQDGSVCMGNAKINIPHISSYTEIMSLWEYLFWNTKFSNSGDNSSMTQWRKIMKGNVKEFPETMLKPHQKYATIKDLLR